MVARQPNKGEVRVTMKKATNHTNPQKFCHHHKVPKQDGGDGVNDGDNEEDNQPIQKISGTSPRPTSRTTWSSTSTSSTTSSR